jgi:hypothetical protein
MRDKATIPRNDSTASSSSEAFAGLSEEDPVQFEQASAIRALDAFLLKRQQQEQRSRPLKFPLKLPQQ